MFRVKTHAQQRSTTDSQTFLIVICIEKALFLVKFVVVASLLYRFKIDFSQLDELEVGNSLELVVELRSYLGCQGNWVPVARESSDLKGFINVILNGEARILWISLVIQEEFQDLWLSHKLVLQEGIRNQHLRASNSATPVGVGS